MLGVHVLALSPEIPKQMHMKKRVEEGLARKSSRDKEW